MQSIILGGGCFWCTEAVYQRIPGITKVIPGYAGGHTQNPSYETVCEGNTDHAEVVKVEFEPDQITLEKILEIFWLVHDPTSLNRQGNDVGTQYRSAIFFTKPEQEKIIVQLIEELQTSGKFVKPIVTEVKRLDTFYPAEEYYHNYFNNNPNQAYCQVVVRPKIEKTTHLY